MRISVLSLFPEMFTALTEHGVSGRAVDRGLLTLDIYNPRDYTSDKHRTVDDRPYGGGPGMVMKIEPLEAALMAAKVQQPQAKVVYLSPQGQPLKQAAVESFSNNDIEAGLILLAGRYEGVDERFIDCHVDEEWSIGDYVLSGGELAAMVMVDAITRLLPGVLGHEQSAQQDSFGAGLLDCPHYTRPEQYAGRDVPKVLLSGNHAEIARWRMKQAVGRTWQRRPDLLEEQALDEQQKKMLKEFQRDDLQE